MGISDYSIGDKRFFESGREHERERIIKLLESLGCKANGIEHDCQGGLGYTTAQDLIKLIKAQ